jgi:hypothetical protein
VLYVDHSFLAVTATSTVLQSDPTINLTLQHGHPVKLSLTGPAGARCRIEAADTPMTDNDNWHLVTEVVLSPGTTTVSDPDADSASAGRFYRASTILFCRTRVGCTPSVSVIVAALLGSQGIDKLTWEYRIIVIAPRVKICPVYNRPRSPLIMASDQARHKELLRTPETWPDLDGARPK